MVFFALTRPGYDELRSRFGAPPSPLWVNKDVLSESELADLRATGINVTHFTHHVAPKDRSSVEGAVDTIATHHPNDTIWVEQARDL